MQKTLQLLSGVLIAAILNACAVTPKEAPSTAPEPEVVQPSGPDWASIAADFQGQDAPDINVSPLAGGGLQLVIPAADGFETAKADVRPSLLHSLNALVEPINRHPELQVHILGHTDSIGREGYNMVLSRQRARAVQDALMNAGVAPMRLSSEGRGEMEPVADNDTPEGRSQNRRVEIRLQPIK